MIRQYVEMAKADIESIFVETDKKIGGRGNDEVESEKIALQNLKNDLKIDDKFAAAVLKILHCKDEIWSLENNPGVF